MLSISYLDLVSILFAISVLTYVTIDGLGLIKYKTKQSKPTKAIQSVAQPKTVKEKPEVTRGRNISYILNKH